MLQWLKYEWKALQDDPPGERFKASYERRREHRSHPAMRWLYMALGSVLVVLGLVMLPAPGPGFLVLIPGAALMARESLLAARVCDAVELRARSTLRALQRSWRRVRTS